MSTRRLPLGVATAAAVALVTAVAACGGGLTGTGGPSLSGTARSGTAHSGTAGDSKQTQPLGVPVPAHGAYMGSYIQPAVDTPAGQIAAVQSFEQRTDSSLQIVHVYHPWGTVFPTAADRYFVNHGKILLLTWGGNPNTKAIIAGKDDAMIRARALAVKALGHPIMLEFRHEMDRPNLQWTIHGPADYIAAWDHIRAIFTAVGATNVSWVWCPTGTGFQVGRAGAFYPGNNEVDWVCADVYSASTAQPLSEAAAPFLRWASHHDKPIIIGEFGEMGSPPGLATWLTAAGQFAEDDPQIKAMAYFDANGIDSTGTAFQLWLGDQPAALSAFAGLLDQGYFRPAVRGDP